MGLFKTASTKSAASQTVSVTVDIDELVKKLQTSNAGYGYPSSPEDQFLYQLSAKLADAFWEEHKHTLLAMLDPSKLEPVLQALAFKSAVGRVKQAAP